MYCEEVLDLFVFGREELTASYLQDFLRPVYSPTGSNDKAKEDKVVYNWMTYIQETAGMCVWGAIICVPFVIPWL